MKQTDKFILSGATQDEVWPLIRDHHYSGRMPANVQHCFSVRKPGGLFGDTGEPVAAVVFTIPPTKWSEEIVELARLVRIPDYDQPLTQLIAFASRWLRKAGWSLAVSFADWTHNHHGGIYQAAGWKFGGKRERAMDGLIIDGTFKPGRSCNSTFGTRSPGRLRERLQGAEIEPHYDEGKFLYWHPLAVSGRSKARRLGLESLPYPKPDAAGPPDERLPSRVSLVQPEAAAPITPALADRE